MQSWNYKNFTIHQFQELESSNSHAFNLADSRQIFDHEIIVANKQNKGRGRKDRKWFSPDGNLYFSIVLQPKVSLPDIHQLSFVAITALQIAIDKITKNKVQVKWPNDLLINEKKVAGILLENKINQNQCQFVILGIGLNINSNPSNTIFPASNLENFNINISPKIALESFLNEFENLYQNWQNFGFEPIKKLWLKNPYRLEEEITVKIEDNPITGIFDNLDEEGNLILKYKDELKKVYAADVLCT